jgi:hypothetical protein
MKHILALAKVAVASLSVATCFSFTGCASNGADAKPEIHGDMGVRVESQDTRRIRPVQ